MKNQIFNKIYRAVVYLRLSDEDGDNRESDSTLTEQAEYEIVAVFKTVAYSSDGFRYYDFVDAENEEEFNSYVGKCKELALYDTGAISMVMKL